MTNTPSSFCKKAISFFLMFYFISVSSFAQSLSQAKGFNSLPSGDPSQKNMTNINSLRDNPSMLKNLKGKNPFKSSLGNQILQTQQVKVHVLGQVVNPGIYNVPIGSRVSNVISQAELKMKSQRIVQIRKNGEKTKYYDLYRYYNYGQLSQNPYVNDGDIVFIAKAKGAVRIEGPVTRPGVLELWGEKSIWDIVRLAGGQTSSASRTDQVRVIRFSEGGRKFISKINNTKSALRKFKIQKGDTIVIPDIVTSNKKFNYSIESIPGENIFYPTSTPEVFVMGEVNTPGAYPYKSHLVAKDYIAYSGPKADAKLRSVTVVRNGKRSRLKFDGNVQAGDILIVKPKIRYTTILTTVSTSLSVVLTAIILNNNI